MSPKTGLESPTRAEAPLAHATKFDLVGNVTFGFVFTWMAIEPFQSHSKLRRQAALGLADPVVTNRILIWVVGRR